MSSYNGSSSSLSKWQLALVVGAPVAVGLGYLCYRNYVNDKPKDEENAKALKRNNLFSSSVDGDDDKTTGAVKSKSEKPTARSDVHKSEGNKLFSAGKYDEAIEQYNLAIQLCPLQCIDELATYYQNRAACYEKLQKYSTVKADCSKALELKPKYVKALLRRAKALEHFDDLVTALEDVTAACILERFANITTVSIADRILKKLGKKHTEEYVKTRKPVMPSKYFIRTYFSAFQHDPITSAINEKSDEDDENSPYRKALEAVKKQEYDDVIPLCTEELKSLAADDNSMHKMKVLLLRGSFNLLLGMYQDALSDLNTIIDSDAASKELKVNALIKRASMHVQLEQPEKSFDDFEEAVKLDPDCSDIYHNRGQVNLLAEKIQEAKSDFDKAVELHPDFGVAFVQKCYTDYRYSVAQRDMNLVQEAIENFNNACTRFPDCAECFNLYAQVLADTNDYQKADLFFKKAADKDPKNATILVQRGLLHLQWKSDFKLAINLIKSAIEIDDKCEFAYETLGTIEVQRGNLEYAIDLFEKALALGRTNMELTHLFSLRDASKAQLAVGERLGVDLKSSAADLGMLA